MTITPPVAPSRSFGVAGAAPDDPGSTQLGDEGQQVVHAVVALALAQHLRDVFGRMGFNDQEIPDLMRWAHGRGMDLTLIETMPMGEIEEDRTDHYMRLSEMRRQLEEQFTFSDIPYRTGGPARYLEVAETGGRLGLITPMTHNFCESCNRVRLTCTGTLYMCLGQNDAADLRTALRASEDDAYLSQVIDEAIGRKPKGHDFIIDRNHRKPAVARHMSVTGG